MAMRKSLRKFSKLFERELTAEEKAA